LYFWIFGSLSSVAIASSLDFLTLYYSMVSAVVAFMALPHGLVIFDECLV
jgi:hypothetical protein